jgi:hypothetical protein
MRLTSTIIFLVLMIAGTSMPLHAQNFIIVSDSSKSSIDVYGQFNGAEVQLPAVKKQPEFPGGKKAWQDFLRSNINIKVPFENKANPGAHMVMVRFIVRSNGKLSWIGADSNCGYGMEAEVIRCIKKTVDWIPAETSSGKKVAFTMRTIVVFTVKQNDVSIGFQ